MKIILIVIIVLGLSLPAAAEISTPWNNPKAWEGTWQMGFVNKIGRFGIWFARELMKEKEKKKSENPLNRPYLQKFDIYEDLVKKAKSIEDLEIIKEHIKKHGIEKYGSNLNKKFKELYDDIDHIIEYEKQMMLTQSITTIIAMLAMLGRLVVLGG